MTRRQWRLSGLVVCLASAVSASLVLAAARGAAVEPSPVEGCQVSIAGRDMSRADRPTRALRIPASGTVVVTGLDGQATASAAVDATLSPGMPERAVWRVQERHFNPAATAYQIPLDMNDVASYGVGINVITVSTDHCTTTAWL